MRKSSETVLSHDWSSEVQPLAYQIGRSTCWVTSIINGIMFLRNGERIGYLQYKTMQSTLNSFLRSGKEGKYEGVWFETDEEFGVYENVMKLLENTFSLCIRTASGAEVADEIRRLHFCKQVAVCSVGNGDHGILLNGKSECGNWLLAFDPWWYDDKRTGNKNVQFPKNGTSTNVRIKMCHLFEPYVRFKEEYKTGRAYPMGMNLDERCLTVIESTT